MSSRKDFEESSRVRFQTGNQIRANVYISFASGITIDARSNQSITIENGTISFGPGLTINNGSHRIVVESASNGGGVSVTEVASPAEVDEVSTVATVGGTGGSPNDSGSPIPDVGIGEGGSSAVEVGTSPPMQSSGGGGPMRVRRAQSEHHGVDGASSSGGGLRARYGRTRGNRTTRRARTEIRREHEESSA